MEDGHGLLARLDWLDGGRDGSSGEGRGIKAKASLLASFTVRCFIKSMILLFVVSHHLFVGFRSTKGKSAAKCRQARLMHSSAWTRTRPWRTLGAVKAA